MKIPKAILNAQSVGHAPCEGLSRTEIIRGMERTLMAQGKSRTEARQRIQRISNMDRTPAVQEQFAPDISAGIAELIAVIRS